MQPVINLTTQIKKTIGHRILICFLLATIVLLVVTASDIINTAQALEKNLEAQCAALENFAISQILVQNESAIQPKLDSLNRHSQDIQFVWNHDASAATEKKLHWHFPFSWTYTYPVTNIDGSKLGVFIVNGSLRSDRELFSDFTIQVTLLLLFFIIIFVVLHPLGKRIPQKLFITPINNLLSLLRNGKNLDTVEKNVVIPEEINEIRDKITALLKDAEERSREAALGQLATQVAHDIRSPLVALKSLLKEIENIPEERRNMIRNAVNRINDIANSLLLRKKHPSGDEENNGSEPELISVLIDSIASEKRVQYSNTDTEIHLSIHANTYGLFAMVNAGEFKRVMSNIINNAMESIKTQGEVNIKVTNEAGVLKVEVRDNGCGIPAEKIPQVLQGGVSFGKANGSGLGLSNAVKLIEKWGGRLTLNSVVNQGTAIEFTLPVVKAPVWFLSALPLHPEMNVVVLDDDESIHGVWKKKFQESGILEQHVQIFQFYDSVSMMKWCETHQNEIVKTLFLLDYELLGDTLTGLEIAKKMGITNRATLVTGQYEDLELREKSRAVGMKMIPKYYTSYLPIFIFPENPDLIFIDDSVLLTDAWEMAAARLGKSIVIFHHAADVRLYIDAFSRDIPIFMDSNLKESISGEMLAKELYEKGFHTIYLATGYENEHFTVMPWIKKIVGKEFPEEMFNQKES